MYSRHPDPRRMWKGGSEKHLLTPLLQNPRAPRANSKKLDLEIIYNDFGTFARKDVVHFPEKPVYAPEDPKASRRDPKGAQRETKGRPKRAQWHPKGAKGTQSWPKGRPKRAQGYPKGAKGSPKLAQGMAKEDPRGIYINKLPINRRSGRYVKILSQK